MKHEQNKKYHKSETKKARKSRTIFVCETCGSTHVYRDAWAEWDPDKDEWVLAQSFDETFCVDCDGPTAVKMIEIDKEVDR